jgi:hypothetical protein
MVEQTLHRKKINMNTPIPITIWGKMNSSRKVSRYCSTSGTRRAIVKRHVFICYGNHAERPFGYKNHTMILFIILSIFPYRNVNFKFSHSDVWISI